MSNNGVLSNNGDGPQPNGKQVTVRAIPVVALVPEDAREVQVVGVLVRLKQGLIVTPRLETCAVKALEPQEVGVLFEQLMAAEVFMKSSGDTMNEHGVMEPSVEPILKAGERIVISHGRAAAMQQQPESQPQIILPGQ